MAVGRRSARQASVWHACSCPGLGVPASTFPSPELRCCEGIRWTQKAGWATTAMWPICHGPTAMRQQRR
eukprot:10605354-Karenia_brevis.AAC.1